MLNLQPEMNLNNQVRKGLARVIEAMNDEDMVKATYIVRLINKMLEDYELGKPQPWSNFQPMIDEEFNN